MKALNRVLMAAVVAMVGWSPARAVASPAAPDEPAAGQASGVSVETRVAPNPSSVGDVLDYEVIVAFPRGMTVNLPSLLDVSPMHLVDSAESPVEATGAALRKTFTLQLQHFAVGDAAIPAFELTTVDADGAVQTVDVPPHPLTVEALSANEPNPVRRGEDPPVSFEYPNAGVELAVYGGIAGAVFALLGWLLWRRMRNRPRSVPAAPPTPPHQLALQALDELEQTDVQGQADAVSFYVQLTEIAKGYLEGRFGVPSLDRTTDEIRRELLRQGDAIAPLSADDVIAFLMRCDLVKFARCAPEADEASAALSEVRLMVTRTLEPRPTGEQDPRPKSGSNGAPEVQP